MARSWSASIALVVWMVAGAGWAATPYSLPDGVPTATLEINDISSKEGATEYHLLGDAESCSVVFFIPIQQPATRFKVPIEAGKTFVLRSWFRSTDQIWECASTIRFQAEEGATYSMGLNRFSVTGGRRTCEPRFSKFTPGSRRGVKEGFDRVCPTPPASDKKSNSELFVLAVERLDLGAVRELLQQGVDPDTRFARQSQYETALHLAAAVGNRNLAELLLDHGADIQRRSAGDYTPLHIAIGARQVEMARYLVERGANVNADTFSMGGPLHYAVYHGQPEVAKLLIERGASIDQRTKTAGKTPLHYIEYQYRTRNYMTKHEAAVQIVLRAKPDLTIKDNEGRTVAQILDARPTPRGGPSPLDELLRELDKPRLKN